MKNTSRYVAIKIQIPHATTIIIPILPVGSLNSSWVFYHPPEVGSTGRQGGKTRQGHRWHRHQELRRIQATRRRVLRGEELPQSFRSSTESAREPRKIIESDHDLVLKPMVLGNSNVKKSLKMVI